MRTFLRALRILSVITLFFFCWTFLPLWQAVAWAAEKKQGPGTRVQGTERQASEPRVQGPGERFEKALEGIREHIGKAEEKSRKGQEPSEEVNAIKVKKAEIESIDAELKTEFAATEKKLKDANLPSEILDRHHKFVKHYQDNLKELVGNLEQVERAKTKTEVEAKVKKAKAHLDRVKKPSTHKKLDPNKLPHRTVKAKERAPRLKQEQFERDFPQHKTNSKQKIAASRFLPDIQTSRAQHKPVLLAFNETASDVPLTLGVQPPTPQFAFADSPLFLLAQQTADLPSADDLSENTEIQFTAEIRAKALELENNPVKIYEYVRNNIEFVPTYGSIQGANMCLQTKQCNDFDTASLLISLLRASNISAHYVYGTIEVPIEKVMNWVGGFTDPRAAVNFIASGGIPVKPYASGGVITKIQMEHAWVEAWIDYIPSRGAKHKIGDTWIPLDASYKQYEYKKGLDVQQIAGFDPTTFADSLKNSGIYDPSTGSITGVNTALIQSKVDEIKTALKARVDSLQNPTIGDVIGAKDIVKEELDLLPASLPYRTILTGGENAEISDTMRHKIVVSVNDPQSMTQSLTAAYSMPSIAGKRITLAYMPATDVDARLIDSSGGMYKTKPYLLKLKPVLYIAGVPMAVGEPTTMGNMQSLSVTFSTPQGMSEVVTHPISAATFAAIGLDLQNIPITLVKQTTAKLEQTKNLLGVQDVPFDDIIGETLNLHALAYFSQVEGSNRVLTSGKVTYLKHPSEMLVTLQPNIGELWGVPYKVDTVGMQVDVKRYLLSVVSLKGDVAEEKAFMLAAGNKTSAAEHAIFEETRPAGYQGISAVKAMSYANQQGIPLFTIDSTNINRLLPLLSISQEALTNIQNAVAAGKIVTVPQRSIQYYDWQGDGYIIIDPNSGAGAYMISGGLAGGGTTSQNDPVTASMTDDLQNVLNFIGNGLAPVAEAARIAGKIISWARHIGLAIGGLLSIATYAQMTHETHCPINGLLAGGLDALLNYLAGLAIVFLVSGLGIFGAIFIVILVTVFVMILENILLDYIRNLELCSTN